MSATETTETGGTELETLPTFELSYLFDDADNPREVTLFPGDESADLMSEWLTVAVEDAIPLEKIR